MTDGAYTGPPIIDADYQREPFVWCQVVYLYARELHKAGVDYEPALREAMAVRDAMEPWGSPTPTVGAPEHERAELLVHWPTLVCAANAYASMPIGLRAQVIERIGRGIPASEMPVGYVGGCDRKVLDDDEYHPAPPCIPQEVASTTITAVGAFTVTALLTWILMRRPRRTSH